MNVDMSKDLVTKKAFSIPRTANGSSNQETGRKMKKERMVEDELKNYLKTGLLHAHEGVQMMH